MASSTKKPAKAKTAAKSAPAKKASKAAPKKADSAKPKASKPATPSKATPAVNAAQPTLVNKPQPVVLGPAMRKKELIDTVVTRTGIKKKDAKPVIEGMLAVLGVALAEGRELILPPLGKVIVRKEKKLPRGKMMIVKVRQTTAPVAEEAAGSSDPEY